MALPSGKNGRGKGVKRVYRANVEGNRGRAKPQRRWNDEVKEGISLLGSASVRGIRYP